GIEVAGRGPRYPSRAVPHHASRFQRLPRSDDFGRSGPGRAWSHGPGQARDAPQAAVGARPDDDPLRGGHRRAAATDAARAVPTSVGTRPAARLPTHGDRAATARRRHAAGASSVAPAGPQREARAEPLSDSLSPSVWLRQTPPHKWGGVCYSLTS